MSTDDITKALHTQFLQQLQVQQKSANRQQHLRLGEAQPLVLLPRKTPLTLTEKRLALRKKIDSIHNIQARLVLERAFKQIA